MRLAFTIVLLFSSLQTAAADPVWLIVRKQLRQVVGPAEIDCGIVPAGEDARVASNCAVDAFKSRRAFVVGYYLRGIDSAVGRGVASNGSGQVFEYHFDIQFAADQSGAVQSKSVKSRQCSEPTELVLSRTGLLHCGDTGFESDVGLCAPVLLRWENEALPKTPTKITLIVHAEGDAVLERVEVPQASVASIEALKRGVLTMRFAPAMKDGVPVNIRVAATLNFKGDELQFGLKQLPSWRECTATVKKIQR